MTKTMSPKQLAANRCNAQKSTGPRTQAGCAVSKMNALKHGILSKQVLVLGLNLKEDSRELIALHQRFWEDLNPAGPLEEMLVDQIVTTHWRLRRALTAESGEITLSVDEGHWQRTRGPKPALQWLEWERPGDPIPRMKDSALGTALLEQWLAEVREAVEQSGELTEAAIQKLIEAFRGKPNSLTRELEELRLTLQQNPDGLEAAALRQKQRNQALAFLNRKLSSLAQRKAQCEEQEANAEQARQAAAVLPSLEVLEKILRYETRLQRQLYRAMAHLDRLQRIRRGQPILASGSVEPAARREKNVFCQTNPSSE